MSEHEPYGSQTPPHIPVMSAEIVDALKPVSGGVYVDGTFGAGGYTRALLEAQDCTVVALDIDPSVKPTADEISRRYPGRFHFTVSRFGKMAERVPEVGFSAVDGVALDVGASSMQLDQAGRGFSFQSDGPLDMRMGADGPSAADAVNNLDQDDLAAVLFRYGDERRSRLIARKIVEAREQAPIVRTGELAELVARTISGTPGRHAATRTFQALRVFINDELRQLYAGLCAAERLLRPAGRLAVVSFHSLEDRIVKQFFAERSGTIPSGSRHLPPTDEHRPVPSFKHVWRGAHKPGAAEIAANPRARSARLRCGERTQAPAWTNSMAGSDILTNAPLPISAMVVAGD